MDVMKIKSKLLMGVVSHVLSSKISKLGYSVDVQTNEIEATMDDVNTKIHLNIDLACRNSVTIKLLKDIGLM